jgi:hypothetical protein
MKTKNLILLTITCLSLLSCSKETPTISTIDSHLIGKWEGTASIIYNFVRFDMETEEIIVIDEVITYLNDEGFYTQYLENGRIIEHRLANEDIERVEDYEPKLSFETKNGFLYLYWDDKPRYDIDGLNGFIYKYSFSDDYNELALEFVSGLDIGIANRPTKWLYKRIN